MLAHLLNPAGKAWFTGQIDCLLHSRPRHRVCFAFLSMQTNSFTARIETTRNLVSEWTDKDVTLRVHGHKSQELVLKAERLPLSSIAILPLREASFRYLESGSLA